MNGLDVIRVADTFPPVTACGAVSNDTAGTVINPAMSARLTTRLSHSITYGKVRDLVIAL